ncbi:trichohyalin-like [Mizuhopecten yessoensis]|uniref:Limbin n=1 Tax=Mizuhopecten yessoensis TaxID=6573 RepID=A0A210Q549_MIZYE|nr:trichohyalin-like [Mizuhopecten yessoensis]OWF43866.1 Limbin [Mizuhopecten yessoensis]
MKGCIVGIPTLFAFLLCIQSVSAGTLDFYLTGTVELYEEFNASSFNGNNYAAYNVSYYAPSAAVYAPNVNQANYVAFSEHLTMAATVIDILDIYDTANAAYAGEAKLHIESVVEQYDTSVNPDQVQISMWIYNTATSAVASTVMVDVDLTAGLEVDYDISTFLINGSGNTFNTDITVISKKQFTWSASTISGLEGRSLQFIATPSGSVGRDLAVGANLFTSSVTYYLNATEVVGPIDLTVCVSREDSVTESVLYQHGLTALTFFMALILGVIIVIVGVVVYRLLSNRKGARTVHVHEHDVIMHEKGNRLVMDYGKAMSKKGHTITDYSLVNEDESIVGILAMKDRLGRHREIDNLDIAATITVDEGLEEERNESSEAVTTMYVQIMKQNGDISQKTEDGVIQKHRMRKGVLRKSLDDEYQGEKRKLLKKLSAKNKAKMSRLHQKQKVDKRKLVSDMTDIGDEERKQLLVMMDAEHQTEQEEKTYHLKLEQDEEMENLRKEFAARERINQKELQKTMLKDLEVDGNLHDEKVQWLLDEHKESQKRLDLSYDNEISKQRMQLEEKLERRRGLSKLSEQNEDDMSDTLNYLASNMNDFITRAKKDGIVSPDEAKVMFEKAKKEMIALKEQMDKDRRKQEEDLHKKLSNLKKQRMANLQKQQEGELQSYMKSHSAQTDGPVDPLSLVEGKLQLESKHREEAHKVSDQMDQEHAHDLATLREEISTQTEEDLSNIQTQLINNLKNQGFSEDTARVLIKKHRDAMAKLQESQEANLHNQMVNIQERLERNRADLEMRKAQEKQEQALLREREEKLVNNLITGQMVMSDDERDRILQEHEKQMVKLENNLTLNKLRQKRMLEEKLMEKRDRQMHKLQEKQLQQTQAQKRKQENNAEESDDESRKEKTNLLKLQFEQRMVILHGEKLNLDDEMENVRVEMLKQRALALKNQEERLGGMVAALQVSKAHELSKIEDQQKAINDLKMNLMDDLNERGVLGNQECQEIIERYKEEQDKLQHSLADRQRQHEKALKKRLKQRLQQREKVMAETQEKELQEILSQSKNKVAAKIKKALLLHKQMIEMEQMRNRLDREISQTLRETQRLFEMERLQKIQEQELLVISRLISIGGFEKEDLNNVLRTLFPSKTEEDIKKIMSKIYDPQKMQPAPVSRDKDGSVNSSNVNLTARVKEFSRRESMAEIQAMSQPPTPRQRSKKGKSKPKYVERFHEDEEEPSYPSYSRPDPIGEVRESRQQYDEDFMEARQVNSDYLQAQPIKPSQLPPLDAPQEGGGRKKKKKKLLKKIAKPKQDYYDDEDIL